MMRMKMMPMTAMAMGPNGEGSGICCITQTTNPKTKQRISTHTSNEIMVSVPIFQ